MAKSKGTSRAPSVVKKTNSKFDIGNPFTHLEPLDSVCELLKKHGVSEMEWSSSSHKLSLRWGGGQGVGMPMGYSMQAVSHAPSATPSAVTEEAKPAKNDKLKTISSPFVGTFYRSASPESQPYVNEGSTIKVGDVLCIIEAMKLMNAIEAEITGTIKQVLVQNGQPVEFGEPLFLVE